MRNGAYSPAEEQKPALFLCAKLVYIKDISFEHLLIICFESTSSILGCRIAVSISDSFDDRS